MYAGIDIGSLTTKAVLINNGKIIGYKIIKTGSYPKQAGEIVFDKVIAKAGCEKKEVKYIVATGYGRVSLPFAGHAVTELTCHARGVRHLDPAIDFIIDIGGQDSKTIKLGKNGNVADFVMNDRCAAGTGRFLTMMAQALEVDMKKFSEFSISSQKPCPINSTCIVFAESEVISLLASGEAKEDIAAGLIQSIAKRVGNMAKRIGTNQNIAFVGGGAKNLGLRKALEEILKINFIPIKVEPQITGALGAAVLACEQYGG